MNYTVQIDRGATKAILKLLKRIQDSIIDVINGLKENSRPPGCLKREAYKNTYRICVAKDYRVIYTIEDRKLLIIIIAAGDRKDIYRK